MDLIKGQPKPIPPPPAPAWFSIPPLWLTPLLESIRLDRPLDSDAEGERPLVLITVDKTLEEAVDRLNNLPYPWLWCGVMKDDKYGIPVIIIQRVDVLIRQAVAGLKVTTKETP